MNEWHFRKQLICNKHSTLSYLPLFVLLTCIKHFDANVPTDFKVPKNMKMCSAWIRIGEYILPILLAQFNGRMTINVMEMNWQQEAYHGRGFMDMIWKVGWGRSKYKVSRPLLPKQALEFTSWYYEHGICKSDVLQTEYVSYRNFHYRHTINL